MKIGFISDIHEDIVMLKQTVSILEKMQIDEIVCLGDIVGYSVPFYSYMRERDANKVVDLVRAVCSAVVIGNHDLFAIKKIPANRSFFDYPENWYGLDFSDRQVRASERLYVYENNELPTLLTSKNLEYIKNLPEHVVKNCGDHCILFTHYAFPDCTGSSIWSPKTSDDLRTHFNFMKRENCLYSFSGNDHIEGMEIFTPDTKINVTFETVNLPNDKVWVHGPPIARGTTHNGFMVYDSSKKELMAVPLNSEKHIIPRSI